MNEIGEIPALEGLEALRALAGAARIIHRFIPGDMSFAVIEGVLTSPTFREEP
jgi:hypothetical protein